MTSVKSIVGPDSGPVSLVGYTTEALSVEVQRAQLAFFAQVIQETDRRYFDVHHARQAGYRDVVVPPTFFFHLEQQRPGRLETLTAAGVDLRYVLHGEQGFTYHELAFAGDQLELTTRFVDYFEKKNGALGFLVSRTDVSRDRELIAEAENVLIVRNPN